MKKNYNFDHVSNTLTANEAFLKAASQLGTPEYNTLLQLRKDNPNLVIEKGQINKTKNEKENSKNLTYTAMKDFIKLCRDAEKRLNTFEKVYALSKIQRSPYHYVKTWFLDNYANYSEAPEMDKDGYVIVKTKAQLKADAAEKSAAEATKIGDRGAAEAAPEAAVTIAEAA